MNITRFFLFSFLLAICLYLGACSDQFNRNNNQANRPDSKTSPTQDNQDGHEGNENDESVKLVHIKTRIGSGGAIFPEFQTVQVGEKAVFSMKLSPGFTVSHVEGCGGVRRKLQYDILSATQNCTVEVTVLKKAVHAIQNEDHQLASQEELIAYSLTQIQATKQKHESLIETLYQGIDQISWHPSSDSVTFGTYKPELTFQILRSTQKEEGEASAKGLMYVGEQAQHRYAAMSANMFYVNRSKETTQLLKNTMQWLTQTEENAYLNVVTAHISSREDSDYFPHNEGIRKWLKEVYPNRHSINDANTCDDIAMLHCLESRKPDILILSNLDRNKVGYVGIKAAIEYAKANRIPLFYSNYYRNEIPFTQQIHRYMGLTASNNYWSEHLARGITKDKMKQFDTFDDVTVLLKNLKANVLDKTALEACKGNFLRCNEAGFLANFKAGADWYRAHAIIYDKVGENVFETPATLLPAGLLLADKYRSHIDYPIALNETSAWQQAMFADWAVSYLRKKNTPQPDLGAFIVDSSQVEKNKSAHYDYPAPKQDSKTFSILKSNQWTTTGWYAVPGRIIRLKRTDESSATVRVKLNYHRSNTNRAYQTHRYLFPLEVMQNRIMLPPGETVTFSTPYGGPIYVEMSGEEMPISVEINAQGVVHHPVITDFKNLEQLSNFQKTMARTSLPHVDLRMADAEMHLRRDRLVEGIAGKVTDLKMLLDSIEHDHINRVYTLAGFKRQGTTLEDSLPKDVQSICRRLLGSSDCFDPVLHTRKKIQHANYDENAHCGGACSGNPWDSSWYIDPLGWGDNHELGHNLQVTRLNVHYVPEEKRDRWDAYSSRARENSNNIFPYYVKWYAHYMRDKQTTTITDGHMNQKYAFFAFMSDAAKVKNAEGQRVVFTPSCDVMDEGEDRFTAPWKSNKYAAHNGYRMAFYIQMALRAHVMQLAQNERFENGFHLFTLLYQHERIFGKYARSQSAWDQAKDRLGFSEFPYQGHAVYGGHLGNRTVSSMPGNDFMLVSLSVMTEKDWRPYFDMFGLRYSSLAEKQVIKNAKKGKVRMGLYVLESDLPPATMSQGLTFLPLDTGNPSTIWPRAKAGDIASPMDCQV
ncbi:ImpA family metalloprotease [Algicola sagamiensis]|uniref:ImpA family metalloprotease n=1 Tax=Algicola sagamiensis TaxID=163869 RepID=UPI000367D8C4|nr:ImpA family metalloprotease [Algicola sagamiensis]